MKQLILIRHAKSSWEDIQLADIDRPLNKRGKKDAQEMGVKLANKSVKADLIISSPSIRTTQTIIAISKEINYSINNILWDDRLYLCSVYEIEELLSELDDSIKTVVLALHNPAIETIANKLQQEYKIIKFPTCGIISVKINIKKWEDFEEVEKIKGTFDFFLTPKEDKKYLEAI